MTRPIKHPPGFNQYHLYDLETGKCPRKIYLPPNTTWQINQLLKAHSVGLRLYRTEPLPLDDSDHAEPIQEAPNEGSD